jgi:hypothetical protein
MDDVVERSISVYVWCPWCKQPRVDGRYPGEITLMFAPFVYCSWWLSLLIVFTLPSLMFSIQTTRRQLFACSLEWVHRRGHCSRLLWKSSASAHEVHSPKSPFIFKRTAPLIDTNIWQCLLTIPPLQSWTDFRRFTTFFGQEFDYNALFHNNVNLTSLIFLTSDKTAQ